MQTGTRRAARAFTLLEVMIVIVIILAIAGLVTVNLMSTSKTATTRTVQIQLASLGQALDSFQLEFKRYPTEQEGLAVLWNKDQLDKDADQSLWRSFTKEPIPKDTWGHEWGYKVITEEGSDPTYDLWSYGPDGEDGTADDIRFHKKSGDGTDSGSGEAGPPPSSKSGK